MRLIVTILILAIGLSDLQSQKPDQKNFYDFKVTTIDGKVFDFASLRGKKVMIVNTASKCGYTPQYEDLQQLYSQFGGDDFEIIGFPANNFMNQEPGSNNEIEEFCKVQFSVTFPMMSKISVKGDDQHEVYQWLTQKKLNGFSDSQVKWNFQKYLIDEKGNLAKIYFSKTKPNDPEIISWLKKT